MLNIYRVFGNADPSVVYVVGGEGEPRLEDGLKGEISSYVINLISLVFFHFQI